jgi:hypothetical protein
VLQDLKLEAEAVTIIENAYMPLLEVDTSV